MDAAELPFLPRTKADWLTQVQKDLKGADPAALDWRTEDGFVVAPYHTAEDLGALPAAAIQAAQRTHLPRRWLTRETIPFTDEKTTRQRARVALEGGADALAFDLRTADVATVQFARLLDGLKLSQVPITFQTRGQSARVAAALQSLAPYQWQGSFDDDPLAHWMTGHGWPPDAWRVATDLTRQTRSSPAFYPITVSTHAFHQAGASAAQELAFGLGAAVHCLDKLTDEGLTAAEIVPKLTFSVSVGTSYLTEIAKLRALRYLFARVQTAYGLAPAPAFVHAQTSTFFDATDEPYTNLLRGTSEAMAAVVGGCDALTVHPFDASFAPPGDFGARIARNVSTILREEAYFSLVADPAAGSYTLETLTHQLAEAAWALFEKTEALGGVVAAFEQNFVQAEIDRTWQTRADAVRTGKQTLVGVNKYRTSLPPEVPVVPPVGPWLADRRLAAALGA